VSSEKMQPEEWGRQRHWPYKTKQSNL